MIALTHATGPAGDPLDRKLSATDGPFAETKEGLGGSILMEMRMRAFRNGGHGPSADCHAFRVYQTTCAVCGVALAARGSVLFQGDHLVHATCWQADPKPLLHAASW